MKKKIFSAISIVATSSHAIAPAAAVPHAVSDPAELVAYQNAVASGAPADMQLFLTNYPTSSLVGTAIGQLIQQIQPRIPRESAGTASILNVQYGGSRNADPVPSGPPAAAPPVARGAVSEANAQRTLDVVERASGRLQSNASKCNRSDAVQVNNCLGLALSYYATTLSSPKVVLPPQLKSIPRVVARTARTVRTARTTQAARQAVEQAVVDIRKLIKLQQVADDSRAGNFRCAPAIWLQPASPI